MAPLKPIILGFIPPPPGKPGRGRAGDGNRTHVACLEGRYSTIELHPRFGWPPGHRPGTPIAGRRQHSHFEKRGTCHGSSSIRVCVIPLRDGLTFTCFLTVPTRTRDRSNPFISHRSDLGGAGFEPAKALPPDLQSGPFGRLGIHPRCRFVFVSNRVHYSSSILEPARSIFSGGDGFQGRASGETRTHNPRFTKPMLYQLSYASIPVLRCFSIRSTPRKKQGKSHQYRETT